MITAIILAATGLLPAHRIVVDQENHRLIRGVEGQSIRLSALTLKNPSKKPARVLFFTSRDQLMCDFADAEMGGLSHKWDGKQSFVVQPGHSLWAKVQDKGARVEMWASYQLVPASPSKATSGLVTVIHSKRIRHYNAWENGTFVHH